jgi:hypothetical protein
MWKHASHPSPPTGPFCSHNLKEIDMTRTNNACQKAYNEGLEARRTYPLRLGGYKLRESHYFPDRVRRTINNIAADARGKARGYGRPFGSCKSDDAATWLKSVPAMIARELTYNVLPAIEALAADGVPDSIVRECVSRANAEARTILSQCEVAEAVLKQGIKAENSRMKAGNSTLLPLVDTLEDLIEDALDDVKEWV